MNELPSLLTSQSQEVISISNVDTLMFCQGQEQLWRGKNNRKLVSVSAAGPDQASAAPHRHLVDTNRKKLIVYSIPEVKGEKKTDSGGII